MTIIYFITLWILPLFMGEYKEEILLDFKSKDEVPEWLIVNDGIMGGISTSDIEFIPAGYLKFAGNVSLQNNGGFASFRTRSRAFNLQKYDGIKIRIRGDGKRYSFRVRTSNSLDGIAYAADFLSIAGNWQEIRIPFGDFAPRYHGKIILNSKSMDKSNIIQLGFLIAEKQEGPFALEIDWIKAYKD